MSLTDGRHFDFAAVPLPDALRELVALTSAAGVPTSLDVTGQARPLEPAAEESLYRAAQEGLTNVRKHACATRAALVLDYTGEAEVRLEVRERRRRARRRPARGRVSGWWGYASAPRSPEGG